MAKPKAETSKTAKRDESVGRSKKDVPPSPRTFRRTPVREKNKSPSRITTKTPPESPTKTAAPKSPSRRSPSRKSPSRKSPSRKSPSRRSPIRREPISAKRSPGRPTKSDEKPKSAAVKSQKGVIDLIDVDSDSDSPDISHSTSREKPKAAVRGRARRSETDIFPKVILQNIETVKEPTPVAKDVRSYISLVRRSAQKSQSREIDRIVHLKHNDATVRKLTEFSDEDEVPSYHSGIIREQSVRRSEPKVIDERTNKTEVGEWIGALLGILFIPIFVIALFSCCDETQCSFTKLPNLQKYKYPSTYVNNSALLSYSAYALFIAILSALPIGGSKASGLLNKQGKLDYVLNGLFCLILTSLALVSLEYFKVPVISFILKRYFQLVVSSLILGILFSVYLYVHSFFVPISALNPYAISNSKIYNFWIGRELNPRAFRRIDIKCFLMRIFVIGVILLNSIFIYKNIEFVKSSEVKSTFDIQSINYNPTLLVIGTLQIIYAIDYLIFESGFLTTLEVQYDGLGYSKAVVFFSLPFSLTLITKYVYDHGVKLPAWQLVAAVLIFVVGYFLFRGSNLQKHAFRQNPYSPALSHLESIPTSQGKKLIVSGYWGFVRHPNYLGDILILLSFATFALNAPPSIVMYFDILFLLHRASVDGKRCKKRYGTAWDRYCQRVKYVLIPKIY